MRRIVGSLVVLALALGTGCSESDEAAAGASVEGAAVKARSLPEIWADILAQRDRLHAAISKGTEMWHEDCAEVASAAVAFDPLVVELGQRATEQLTAEPRHRGIQELCGYLQATTSMLRSEAIEEKVGVLPGLLISVDALLQGLENHFTREEIGNESVVTRPGFNPVRPPPPPSPV
jgi:hypothetical protein